MLDDVNHPDTVKAVIWKWVGKLIQVMNNIDAFQRHDVQSDASRPFVFAATNIENLKTQGQFPRVASKARTVLHCIEIMFQCKLRSQLLGTMRRESLANGSTATFRQFGAPVTEIVVQKYGGSSVADIPKLERVADRVVTTAKQGKKVCVVVSAMGRTTDDLIRLANQITDSPPRRELDMLLSTGERITMALLAMAIQKRGLEAISFTGSQSGIMTNDRHSGARIIEVRPIRIQDELERNKVVIVAGFQGMSYRREITTLGRGGSDTTAVALAAALGASCEICSDVDGVYTADPRVVPDAQRLGFDFI